MYLKCKKCGHKEETSMSLWSKIIGTALPAGGFYAWVTYLFAGTGFAIEIVIAMIAGGIGLLVFKNDIIKWISNKKYNCPKCGKIDWLLEE